MQYCGLRKLGVWNLPGRRGTNMRQRMGPILYSNQIMSPETTNMWLKTCRPEPVAVECIHPSHCALVQKRQGLFSDSGSGGSAFYADTARKGVSFSRSSFVGRSCLSPRRRGCSFFLPAPAADVVARLATAEVAQRTCPERRKVGDGSWELVARP